MLTNIVQKIVDNKLILEVDLNKEFGRSGSGKTIRIATSYGFSNNESDGIAFSLNVNKKESWTGD